MDWNTSREAQIAHFIKLMCFDAEYARYALRTYLAMEHCPHPDIKPELKRRWDAMTEEERMAPWAKETRDTQSSAQPDGLLSTGA